MFLGGHESADTQEPANISFKLLLIGGHQSSVVGYLIIRFLVVYKRGIKKKKDQQQSNRVYTARGKKEIEHPHDAQCGALCVYVRACVGCFITSFLRRIKLKNPTSNKVLNNKKNEQFILAGRQLQVCAASISCAYTLIQSFSLYGCAIFAAKKGEPSLYKYQIRTEERGRS